MIGNIKVSLSKFEYSLKDIFLITPPFTQLNTPYPATAYLKGFLNTKAISAYQMDLGIEVILALFSKNGLKQVFSSITQHPSPNNQRIYSLKDNYIKIVEDVLAFLQGKNPSLARQICSGNFLPEASRFEQLDDMEWAFGTMGLQDKAKYLATLFLEDISDFIVECVDENFGFSRYAERLGRSANSFDELYSHLQAEQTYIDELAIKILKERVETIQPKLLCFSVPFPGNLYSAFRCAQFIKQNYPQVKIAMGGGFANTELRELKDKRVFEFFDFITLDDGELPVELLFSTIQNPLKKEYKRTFLLENDEVVYKNNSIQPDYKQREVGTPDYSDLKLDCYISVIEMANSMHTMWSDGRWNKLTMAHGCYWGKCTFCDISLDYIKIYEPIHASLIVDRMEQLIAQTGETGFHFVDEAAPPALMREVALEILNRNLVVTWWTNIRFEKSFTSDLCLLLKASGCIAVSGGLEVASDRLLQLIQKGVTVAQVAQVTKNFTESGILVHAYLMYGFPSQTIQEIIDSLEMVRQLFELGIVQSGFWHQFAMTAHAPVGLQPHDFGVTPEKKQITFAHNDIQFKDPTGIDHEQFSFGLKKALFNYMHGIGFEYDLQEWFEFKIPKTTISPIYIQTCIEEKESFKIKPTAKVIWLGTTPTIQIISKSKNGSTWELVQLDFHFNTQCVSIALEVKKGEWLVNQLASVSQKSKRLVTLQQLKTSYEVQFEDFELFWFSKSIMQLRQVGLVVV